VQGVFFRHLDLLMGIHRKNAENTPYKFQL